MQVDLHNIQLRIKQIWIWMLRKDAFIYLLFVALATLFWWGSAMSSQREMDIKIPITYTDIPAQVVFSEPLPSHLKIKIRDNGRMLRQVQHTKAHLAISLSKMLEKKDGTLHLSTDILRQKTQDLLPGSTDIQQISPEEILIDYQIESVKSVPIKSCVEWTLAEQHLLSTPISLEPSIIEIYGSQQVIDSIDTIYTRNIAVENIQNVVQTEVALEIPTGIRTVFNSTTITWHAEQFTEKSFTIPIEVQGVPQGENIHLFPNTTTIVAQVGLSHFASLVAEDFRAVCHYPTLQAHTLSVTIQCTNPHVAQVRSNIQEVEYIIER